MPNSWDKYYLSYIDWDESHCFNVRIELKYEDEINRLGYSEYCDKDDMYLIEKSAYDSTISKSRTYRKNKNEIILSFDVPYDWSIDTDWEDKALSLLGLCEEWVIDSSVEDR